MEEFRAGPEPMVLLREDEPIWSPAQLFTLKLNPMEGI
jgi:hypothetical protein